VEQVAAWEREVGKQRQYGHRRAEATPLYQVVSAGRDKLVGSWELLFQHQYGALRNEVVESFDKFLECGILRYGCGRAHCTNPECNHSELIPFSCKQRCLCPSCDAKRAVLFAEKLEHEILLKLPHHHVIFTLPKRIRPYFRFDRSNLSILYQAAWQAWAACVAEQCPEGKTGAILALHSAGDLLSWHPHAHSLCLAGALLPDGSFMPLKIDAQQLCKQFAQRVLAALVAKELISKEVADAILSWEHSGFSAFIGERIEASDTKQRLFVGRYLKKCPISNERLSVSVHGKDTVVHLAASKQDRLDAELAIPLLEFLALLQCHIPSRWEQTTRFFGVYSCRARGMEKARAEAERAGDDESLAITSNYLPESGRRPSPLWAECMKRVFEVDPLQCPKCKSPMKLKAFITDASEIARIAKNLGICLAQAPPPLPCTIPLAA
jgi:hypothetical protein